ncbi:GfV-C7-ORF2 [Ichnoviriform fumiferanae]|uniref:GfV-C7-ORF2 n=1 Tax=Ichnoviriform fumiferanae TaxID=419435 RepID=A2PZX1_9VIRU|nr:GfV-C7-ORF2 [Ichnoviriform fumiferanae]BAF45543.1 GfV-C7-ORF2 [Ichnoviriform fumiferanae]
MNIDIWLSAQPSSQIMVSSMGSGMQHRIAVQHVLSVDVSSQRDQMLNNFDGQLSLVFFSCNINALVSSVVNSSQQILMGVVDVGCYSSKKIDTSATGHLVKVIPSDRIFFSNHFHQVRRLHCAECNATDHNALR